MYRDGLRNASRTAAGFRAASVADVIEPLNLQVLTEIIAAIERMGYGLTFGVQSRIVKECPVPDSGRTLFWYDRR